MVNFGVKYPGCNSGCTVYSFVGNINQVQMDLVIAKNNDRVTDIYDSSQYKCEQKLSIKKRIVLDNDNFLFELLFYLKDSNESNN